MAIRFALDASALLCLLNGESGKERVRAALTEAAISSVNYSEVVAKIVERGGDLALVHAMLDPLHLMVVDFDRAQALSAGELRRDTQRLGLSLGDRSCLALAKSRDLTALTTDKAWLDFDFGVTVECLR